MNLGVLLLIEHEPARAVRSSGHALETPRSQGFAVEERLKKPGEVLLPLLDRANKMMIRNLKAVRELRQGPTPAVTVGQAGQVNVASQQVNAGPG